MKYLIALSIAANQLVNSLTGGSPTETISSRLGHARTSGSAFARKSCSVLNVIDHHHQIKGEDHCAKAIRHYQERLKADAERELKR